MDPTRALIAAVGDFADRHLTARDVCVGLSGGPDSSALAAAAVRAGLTVEALVVDHGLQQGSADVAARAAEWARSLGASAQVLRVVVGDAGGPEAAARDARYAALEAARGDRPVLLGHTLDDQAETVLLGLARGSGGRSIVGMRGWNAPWGRPLLGTRRSATRAACAAWGIEAHHDPHNDDLRFTRVRVRTEALPLLEDVLAGGVAEALARTGDALRDDLDALDAIAEELFTQAVAGSALAVGDLMSAPRAIWTRVLRRWLREVGATEPTSAVVGAVDALTAGGRGEVAIGGDPTHRLVVRVVDGRLVVDSRPRGR
ncbi:tRNA lysidine(34) synthetase TilS [Gordonia soli]|uniref:tRNA(Ile)-lysidine synthase n=1 Tax=Gordonia soli NBRC 108243 TaxID=1223545 RepID=M0QI58_9ACTN|nr:tRNA lysidine(34) synthetase TilS [Gordonia soli]GAC68134.1 tRNA(Ile)-lysidine synthase [Gordonia soli NBRC 108243]